MNKTLLIVCLAAMFIATLVNARPEPIASDEASGEHLGVVKRAFDFGTLKCKGAGYIPGRSKGKSGFGDVGSIGEIGNIGEFGNFGGFGDMGGCEDGTTSSSGGSTESSITTTSA